MSFAPTSASAQSSTNTSTKPSSEVKEYFPNVPSTIPYLGPESVNPLSYQYYNKEEMILGKPMKEWLRFSICFWHTFRGKGADPFGFPTMKRHFDNEEASIETANP